MLYNIKTDHAWISKHNGILLEKNFKISLFLNSNTVCPGSSDPQEKIFNIFASENETYTIY